MKLVLQICELNNKDDSNKRSQSIYAHIAQQEADETMDLIIKEIGQMDKAKLEQLNYIINSLLLKKIASNKRFMNKLKQVQESER